MRKINLIIALVFATSISNACDYCNCYLGLDPGFNKNTIGFRTNFRMSSVEIAGSPTFKTMHGSHGSTESESHSLLEGSFLGYELFAKIFPIPKLMVVGTLPFQVNTLTFDNEKETRSALSDMTLLAYYQIANTMPHDSISVRHRLFGGLGIKFPTGKSSGASDVDIPMSHELYSGTGSTDYLAALNYIGKYKKLGWNLDLNYKYNTESKNLYQYGHTLNITPRIFYEVKIKSVSIFPHLGAAYENSGHDYYKDEKQEFTGGYIYYGSGGLDLYCGKFSLTTDIRLPFEQHHHGEELEDEYLLFGSINYHF